MSEWTKAAEVLAERHGVEVVRYRKAMSGVSYHYSNQIEAPEPRGAKSYLIFAHEVGHQVLHSANGTYPRWREEIEAWDFALATFAEFGLRGQRKLMPWVQNFVARAVFRARVKDKERLFKEFRRDYPRWAKRIPSSPHPG